jgi:probable HAF family extracellular repeat protein
MFFRKFVGFAVLPGLFLAAASVAAVEYQITVLGSFSPAALNNKGQAVGTGPTEACLYTDGNLVPLGTLGGTGSGAFDINDNGDVVGESVMPNGTVGGFLYSGGTMKNVGNLGGRSCVADGINSSGEVVGYATTAEGIYQPFLYRQNTISMIADPYGISAGFVKINDKSQIAGGYVKPDGNSSLFIYDNGTFNDIGSLGGNYCYVTGINNKGDLIGSSNLTVDGPQHALLYTDGHVLDINGSSTSSEAFGINDAGDVVGWSDDFGGFLYSGGSITYLSSLFGPFVHIDRTVDINNSGQILTWGTVDGADGDVVLLTPVPEPSMAVLLGAGIFFGLVGYRFFRRFRICG